MQRPLGGEGPSRVCRRPAQTCAPALTTLPVHRGRSEGLTVALSPQAGESRTAPALQAQAGPLLPSCGAAPPQGTLPPWQLTHTVYAGRWALGVCRTRGAQTQWRPSRAALGDHRTHNSHSLSVRTHSLLKLCYLFILARTHGSMGGGQRERESLEPAEQGA